MIRILFGVLIGAAMTTVFISNNVVPGSVNGQDVQPGANVTEQELIGTIREAMLSPLQMTINESASTDSGKFLNVLVNEYGLEDLPQANQEGTGLVGLVPDFKSINEKAINLPLAEAGKNIRDKEIAVFYYDFLQRSGFDVR